MRGNIVTVASLVLVFSGCAAQRQRQAEEKAAGEHRLTIALAGSKVCQKLDLPFDCFALVDLATLEKGFGDKITGPDKIAFEMARSLWAQMEENRKERARNRATALSGSQMYAPIELYRPPTQRRTTCARFGNYTSCEETSY